MTITHFRNITWGRYTTNSVTKKGDISHSYSLNDGNSRLQFVIYGELLTASNGQHAHWPYPRGQHVSPAGQVWWPPGQIVLTGICFTGSRLFPATFCNQCIADYMINYQILINIYVTYHKIFVCCLLLLSLDWNFSEKKNAVPQWAFTFNLNGNKLKVICTGDQ